jgi:DNA-3-methyladenine glycosylase I
MERCWWPKTDLLVRYHDREWGVPVHDDRRLFEFLALSSIQAGLSWQIILAKRDAFRQAFAGFEPQTVARYGKRKIAGLMANRQLVRNAGKLEAVVNNAARVVDVAAELGSLDTYLWRFVDGATIINRWKKPSDVPTNSPISDALANDLRRRGFRFVGSTICYAFMQSIGMVNDHLVRCFRHQELSA